MESVIFLIVFKDIKLKFDGKLILENFNLVVDQGQKVLLKAPSGRGKSSLFKMILGFYRPDSGEIFLGDKRLEKRTLEYFRKNIGYVNQDVDLRDQKIGQMIEEIFTYKINRHLELNRTKLLELLSYFNLTDEILEKNAGELSGGERQRLGFIICVLLDRKVWLLDEITSGLDSEMKEKLIDFVLGQKKTVLIISHDRSWEEREEVIVKEW